jgi:hypothetical protein
VGWLDGGQDRFVLGFRGFVVVLFS